MSLRSDREDLTRQHEAIERARADLADALDVADRASKDLRRTAARAKSTEALRAPQSAYDVASRDVTNATENLWQALYDLGTAMGEHA